MQLKGPDPNQGQNGSPSLISGLYRTAKDEPMAIGEKTGTMAPRAASLQHVINHTQGRTQVVLASWLMCSSHAPWKHQLFTHLQIYDTFTVYLSHSYYCLIVCPLLAGYLNVGRDPVERDWYVELAYYVEDRFESKLA